MIVALISAAFSASTSKSAAQSSAETLTSSTTKGRTIFFASVWYVTIVAFCKSALAVSLRLLI